MATSAGTQRLLVARTSKRGWAISEQGAYKQLNGKDEPVEYEK